MGVFRDLATWLWHLLPGNPIVVRVVSTGGKRRRHLWARLGYLLALVFVFLLLGGLSMGVESTSLAALAKSSSRTFKYVSLVQLFLMSFIAPVFCAGAITQEKDANTFHILLTTPLSNAQIVLGSLLSRLLFVWVLLLSGLPVFCITMLYGGVTQTEILESFGLAACTGLITGAIAIFISFTGRGTRRTIFSFFLGVAAYLIGVGAIGLAPSGQLSVAPPSTTVIADKPLHMSWLAPVHPLLALLVVTGQTPAPDPAAVHAYGWPARWLLASPQYGYMALTGLASAGMVVISLGLVRRSANEGEATLLNRITARLPRRRAATHRAPRRVWRNPIAWREASTRASAGGRSALRPTFVLLGLAAGVVLLIAHHAGWWGLGPASADQTRQWLVALTWLELAVILVVVTNTAATTFTREKEALTIELLTCTPLTSRYIVAGMLQGLVRLVVPLILVPTLTVLAFVVADLVHGGPPVTVPEAAPLLPLLLVGDAAVAAMIGLRFSLLSRKTVQAVMISTAVVLGVSGLLSACGAGIAGGSSGFVAAVLPFAPFPALQALIDPWRITGDVPSWSNQAPLSLSGVRITRFVFTCISAALLALVTFGLYHDLVRNYDSALRRQSA